MALITCLDCNTSISDKAKACPKCGRSLDNQPYGIAILFFFVIVAVGFYLTFSLVPMAGFVLIGLGIIGFLITILKKFFSM